MSAELTPKQRQHLKRLAHPLAPVVLVGAAGLSDAVLDAVGQALRRHELIKVKLPKVDGADQRKAMARDLSERSGAQLVQLMGRVALLYLDRGEDLPDKPRIVLPAGDPAPGT